MSGNCTRISRCCNDYLEKYSKAFVFLTLIAGQIVIEGNGNSYNGT